MKEKLYMIPLNDAVDANDECAFCNLERKLEQDLLDHVLGSGSSYMEQDIRSLTDHQGFCRTHFKKMFDYGNTLGNAWILKTHYMRVLESFDQYTSSYKPMKKKFFQQRKESGHSNPVSDWISKNDESCYICNHYKEHYSRYIDTFFYMYRSDELFREKIKKGKGFCLSHFGTLVASIESHLPSPEQEAFYQMLCELTRENLVRVSEDIAWLIEKFDYRNLNADWKTSKDALQRGMQKIKGGYPADSPHQMKK